MKHPQADSTTNSAPTNGPQMAVGWVLAFGFFALAGVFVLTSGHTTTPSAATPDFDLAAIAVGPGRAVLTDPPTTRIAGFDQRCNACHKHFKSTWDGTRPLTQHQHITLSHGINNQCSNCHSGDDRERLVLHDNSSVPYSQAANLCSQCHGPVFRDWERGTHGKTLGSWDLSSTDAHRLSCTECHDPHSPAFVGIAPLPGPNTLRMGEKPAGDIDRHLEERNPLRRWVQPDHDGGHD